MEADDRRRVELPLRGAVHMTIVDLNLILVGLMTSMLNIGIGVSSGRLATAIQDESGDALLDESGQIIVEE